eukprot:gene16207-22371_t
MHTAGLVSCSAPSTSTYDPFTHSSSQPRVWRPLLAPRMSPNPSCTSSHRFAQMIRPRALFTHHTHTHLDEVLEEMLQHQKEQVQARKRPNHANGVSKRIWAENCVPLRPGEDPVACLESLRGHLQDKGRVLLLVEEGCLFDAVSILALLSEDIQAADPATAAVFQPVTSSGQGPPSMVTHHRHMLYIFTAAAELYAPPQLQHHSLSCHDVDSHSLAKSATRRLKESCWAQLRSNGSDRDLDHAFSAIELIRVAVKEEHGSDIVVALQLKRNARDVVPSDVDGGHARMGYWQRVARPRLDALLRLANVCGLTAELPQTLDHLICELKNISIVARHCSNQHDCSDVAEACKKYEEHVYRSKDIYNNLKLLYQRLSVGQAQASNGDIDAAAVKRLTYLLLQSFESWGVQVEEGLSHLLCATSVFDDAAWTGATQLSRQERACVQQLRDIISEPSDAPLLWLGRIQGCRAATQQPHSSDSTQEDTVSRELVVEASDGCGCCSDGDRLLHRYLERGGSMGLPPDTIMLTSFTVKSLLTNHPCPLLRRAVGALSDAYGSDSYAHLKQQYLIAQHPLAVLAMLESCAQSSAASAATLLKHAQVSLLSASGKRALLEDPAGQVAGSSSPPAHAEPARQADGASATHVDDSLPSASDESALHEASSYQGHPVEAKEPEGGSEERKDGASSLHPWDVAYANHLLLQRRHVTADYQPYLTLHGILQGFSKFIQSTMGIQMTMVPATANTSDKSTFGSGLSETTPRAQAPDVWSDNVLCFEVYVPETGAYGVLYIDPGGGYGARQLRFCCSRLGLNQGGRTQATSELASEVAGSRDSNITSHSAAVSIGLKWEWKGGQADGLAAINELMHEMGHGLHLILSSTTPPSPLTLLERGQIDASRLDLPPLYKLFGGLHQPLDLLEVPSTLFERFLADPHTLRLICQLPEVPGEQAAGKSGRGSQPSFDTTPKGGTAVAKSGSSSQPSFHTAYKGDTADGESGSSSQASFGTTLNGDADNEKMMMPLHWATSLADVYKSSHYNALDYQEQVLSAMVDQLYNMFGAEVADADVWSQVWTGYSALAPGTTTLKQLSVLPVATHHQATYPAYIFASCVVPTLWEHYQLDKTPIDPHNGRALRRAVLETGSILEPMEVLDRWMRPPSLVGQSGTTSFDGSFCADSLGDDKHLEGRQLFNVVDCPEGQKGIVPRLDEDRMQRWLWDGS